MVRLDLTSVKILDVDVARGMYKIALEAEEKVITLMEREFTAPLAVIMYWMDYYHLDSEVGDDAFACCSCL